MYIGDNMKKGFTLIELLAVLTVLALIALVTVPGITGSLKKYKTNLYNDQIKNIESAAKIWGSDNLAILPNSSNTKVECLYSDIDKCSQNYSRLIITLKDLQDGGYIDSDLKNVRTKKSFSDTMEIVIEKQNNKLEYQVIDQEFTKYEIGDKVLVTVGDKKTSEFYVIEKSDERDNYIIGILASSNSNKIAWCTSCTNNDNPDAIDTFLNENYTWNYATEKRLITKAEFENVTKTIVNDADKTWINGEYWTSTTYGTTSAYYVNNNTLATSSVITDSHYIRPVIKINKKYVKLS